MNKLTSALFPNLKYTREEILNKYKRRDENLVVTRLAPSPTGFLHIGGVYTALVNERIAHNNGGVFYLRIEDTDKEREVDGAISIICDVFKRLGIKTDEGVISETEEIGEYGPYIQSHRVDIYHTFAAYLCEKGLAYPAFETKEELEEIHNAQAECKAFPGYYGKWAKSRSIPEEEAIKKIDAGIPYVLRFKTPDDEESRVLIHDLIKGDVEMDNDITDFVLLKADGVPTYHFAHAVDDYLMGTSYVIRGGEWLASLPIHVKLFKALDFKAPMYGHVAPVMKKEIHEDGTEGKRKLSKRKDPESNAMYYIEKGYPVKALYVYLYTLINSNFEEWYLANPDKDINEFEFKFENMSSSDGPLYDLEKLDSISREIIYNTDTDTNVKNLLTWASEFDSDLYKRLISNTDMVINIFKTQGPNSIEHRKDLASYSEFMNEFGFLYDDIFHGPSDRERLLEENVSEANLEFLKKEFISFFEEMKNGGAFREDGEKKTIGDLAKELGFVAKKKYDKDPSAYRGMVPEFYHCLRILVTNKTSGISMDDICNVLGVDEVIKRIGE